MASAPVFSVWSAQSAGAQAELERLHAAGEKGDGYAYALEKDARHLPAARRWLLDYGRRGGDLEKRALEAGPEFFRGGQPWLGDVYYKIDARGWSCTTGSTPG